MDILDRIQGAPHKRPEWVSACADLTPELTEAESDLCWRALVAVVSDGTAATSCKEVGAAMAARAGVAEHDFEVTMNSRATFFFCFDDPAARSRALAVKGPLWAGRVKLHLMPWTRQSFAIATTLMCRARVCLEGVPRHAWNLRAVKSLFPPDSFFERIEDFKSKEKEKACFCLWIWTRDADAVAKSGDLKIPEPVLRDPSVLHFPDLGIITPVPQREGPADLLQYEVIIHLDEVFDYSPLGSPGYRSGMMCDENEETWPSRTTHDWRLGVVDGRVRPQPQQRVSALDRLGGGGRRDRSPPPGDGRRPEKRPAAGQGMLNQVAPTVSNNWGRAEQQGFGTVGRHRAGSCPPVMSHLFQVHEGSSFRTDPMEEEALLIPVLKIMGVADDETKISPQVLRLIEEVNAISYVAAAEEFADSFHMTTTIVWGAQTPPCADERPMLSVRVLRLVEDVLSLKNIAAGEDYAAAIAMAQLPLFNNDVPVCTKLKQVVTNLDVVSRECADHLAGNPAQTLGLDSPNEGVHNQNEVSASVLKNVGILPGPPDTGNLLGSAARGVSFLAREIIPPILDTPAVPKTNKKSRVALKDLNNSVTVDPRRSGRIAGLPADEISLDDKATHKLMKESGVVKKDTIVPTKEDHQAFREQFVSPLKPDAIKGLRNMFAIEGKENKDSLKALVLEADGA